MVLGPPQPLIPELVHGGINSKPLKCEQKMGKSGLIPLNLKVSFSEYDFGIVVLYMMIRPS